MRDAGRMAGHGQRIAGGVPGLNAAQQTGGLNAVHYIQNPQPSWASAKSYCSCWGDMSEEPGQSIHSRPGLANGLWRIGKALEVLLE